jgi:hypothetical protein
MTDVELAVRGRESVADWIETTLLTRGTRQLGHDAIYALAEEEIGTGHAQVNLALGVMRRRAASLGPKYPFQVHEVAVRALPSASSAPYTSLLLLTPEGVARQTVRGVPTEEMVVLFERMVERAVRSIWGSAGASLRFGYPSEHGRPVEFGAAIAWLAGKMGIPVGSGYRQPRRKDGGVDVVAWRPFQDRRSGFPVLLVQCTLQSDILAKARDIDVRLWSSWLAMDFEPLTALAIPQTIPRGVVWDEIALHGMVLERLRLSALLTDAEVPETALEWNEQTIAALSECLSGVGA